MELVAPNHKKKLQVKTYFYYVSLVYLLHLANKNRTDSLTSAHYFVIYRLRFLLRPFINVATDIKL